MRYFTCIIYNRHHTSGSFHYFRESYHTRKLEYQHRIRCNAQEAPRKPIHP